MNPEDFQDITFVAALLGYEPLGATHLDPDRPFTEIPTILYPTLRNSGDTD